MRNMVHAVYDLWYMRYMGGTGWSKQFFNKLSLGLVGVCWGIWPIRTRPAGALSHLGGYPLRSDGSGTSCRFLVTMKMMDCDL